MRARRFALPAMVLLGGLAFLMSVEFRSAKRSVDVDEPLAVVVLPAAMQVLVYGGDRYLAANIETVRAMRSFGVNLAGEADFRLRAHLVASQLNPCHEDNYWIGNAALAWGGSEQGGLLLLERSMKCRFWDEWPAFFYGFNEYFFNRDTVKASAALEVAAERAVDEKNPVFFRTLSAVIRANELDDVQLAINMLKAERDQANSLALRESLDSRVRRLQGLLILRNAQSAYQRDTGLKLQDPAALLQRGYLKEFPSDPLKMGYEFRGGVFRLRKAKGIP